MLLFKLNSPKKRNKKSQKQYERRQAVKAHSALVESGFLVRDADDAENKAACLILKSVINSGAKDVLSKPAASDLAPSINDRVVAALKVGIQDRDHRFSSSDLLNGKRFVSSLLMKNDPDLSVTAVSRVTGLSKEMLGAQKSRSSVSQVMNPPRKIRDDALMPGNPVYESVVLFMEENCPQRPDVDRKVYVGAESSEPQRIRMLPFEDLYKMWKLQQSDEQFFEISLSQFIKCAPLSTKAAAQPDEFQCDLCREFSCLIANITRVLSVHHAINKVPENKDGLLEVKKEMCSPSSCQMLSNENHLFPLFKVPVNC